MLYIYFVNSYLHVLVYAACRLLHVFSVQMLLQILVCFRCLLQRDGYKKFNFGCFIHCLFQTGRLVYGLYRHVAVNGTACYCSTILFTQFCPTRTSLDRLLCRVSTLLLLVTLDYGDILYGLLFQMVLSLTTEGRLHKFMCRHYICWGYCCSFGREEGM